MRFSVLAVAAIAISIPAVAQAGNFDGIYGGAQIGGAFTSLEQTSSSPVYSGGSVKSDSLSANGVIGGVFAGYGYVCPGNFFLGGEIDVSFGDREYSYEITDPTNPYKSTIKTGTEWGILARPGYVLNPNTLLYGLIGFDHVPLKSTSSAPEVTFDKDQYALRIGAGAEMSISGPLTLRIDYTHTFLDKVTVSDSFGDAVKTEPSEDKVKVGIAYHF